MTVERWAAAAVMVAALAACDESFTGPSVTIDDTFTMAPGDVVQVEDTSTALEFIGVEGDSRCPGDAICIAAGDAVVRIAARRGGTRHDYELHTGNLAPVRDDGLTITLVELAPYPFGSRGPIAPGDYRASLRVTR